MQTPESLLSFLDNVNTLSSAEGPETVPKNPPITQTLIATGFVEGSWNIDEVELDDLLGAWDATPPVGHQGSLSDSSLLSMYAVKESAHTQADSIGAIAKHGGIIALSWETRKVNLPNNTKPHPILSVRFVINPAKQLFTLAHLELTITGVGKIREIVTYHEKGTEIPVKLEASNSNETTIGLQELFSKLYTEFTRTSSNKSEWERMDTEGLRSTVFEHGKQLTTNAISSSTDGRGLVGGYETVMLLDDDALENDVEVRLRFNAQAAGFRRLQKWKLGERTGVSFRVSFHK